MHVQLHSSSQPKGSRRWLWNLLVVGRRVLWAVLVFLGKHRIVIHLRTTQIVKEYQ
jgi:hypothetical protein